MALKKHACLIILVFFTGVCFYRKSLIFGQSNLLTEAQNLVKNIQWGTTYADTSFLAQAQTLTNSFRLARNTTPTVAPGKIIQLNPARSALNTQMNEAKNVFAQALSEHLTTRDLLMPLVRDNVQMKNSFVKDLYLRAIDTQIKNNTLSTDNFTPVEQVEVSRWLKSNTLKIGSQYEVPTGNIHGALDQALDESGLMNRLLAQLKAWWTNIFPPEPEMNTVLPGFDTATPTVTPQSFAEPQVQGSSSYAVLAEQLSLNTNSIPIENNTAAPYAPEQSPPAIPENTDTSDQTTTELDPVM